MMNLYTTLKLDVLSNFLTNYPILFIALPLLGGFLSWMYARRKITHDPWYHSLKSDTGIMYESFFLFLI